MSWWGGIIAEVERIMNRWGIGVGVIIAMIGWVAAGQAQTNPPTLAATTAATAPPSETLGRAAAHPPGIVMATPYARGKIPVVLVHGLWANRKVWDGMIAALRSDGQLDAKFQFWTFGYATGDPIPYAAWILRRELSQTRHQFDPDQLDDAWDQMVVVGHSMGGLLAKLMVVETGDSLWHAISPRRPEELKGDQADVATLLGALKFSPRPEVRRVIFIATPHAGSKVNSGSLHRLGLRLVRINEFPTRIHDRLMASNEPDFFEPLFVRGMPSSVDELRINGPLLTNLRELPLAPQVQGHSIIAVRANAPAGNPTDGLVTLTSARLPGMASEKIVTCSHLLCLDNAEVITEVHRILTEHCSKQ